MGQRKDPPVNYQSIVHRQPPTAKDFLPQPMPKPLPAPTKRKVP